MSRLPLKTILELQREKRPKAKKLAITTMGHSLLGNNPGRAWVHRACVRTLMSGRNCAARGGQHDGDLLALLYALSPGRLELSLLYRRFIFVAVAILESRPLGDVQREKSDDDE